jgi:hypothetical protein
VLRSAKEVIAAEVPPEEGLSVSQPTKAIRPCAVCFILSHKDGKVKTHYSFNKITGKVDSRVYDGEGTLVRYNGTHLSNNNCMITPFVNA